MTAPILAIALVLAFAGWARANDSTAAFAAGGLVLTETDAIELVSEDLRLARDEIRVRYVFRNTTQADVTTVVAFPLPDIDLSYYSEVPIEQPYPDPDNFVGFTVTVDGVAVEPDLHVRATLSTNDVTAQLAARGIPISLFADDLYQRLWAIPSEDQEALQAAALVYYDRDYDGVYPQWTQHVAFTWTQTFPAGREVVVEHGYHPVVGSRFLSGYTLTGEEGADLRARYCLDDAAAAEIARRLDAAGEDALLVADEVGYVLTTGANWAGPIRDFALTVDAGAPGNLIVSCATPDLPERPSDTAIAGRRADFTPTEDLWVLIVRRDPAS